MNEPFADSKTFWGMHRYVLLLVTSIGIALTLVSISLSLYVSSGTIQLDLSRPGYQSVSNQTDSTNGQVEKFPDTGNLDASVLKDFETVFSAQAAKSKAVDAFGGDPLDPNSLGVYQQN